MKIIFRADASPFIGTGHVMRLIPIALEAIERGHDCIFLGEVREVQWLEELIRTIGFSRVVSFEGELEINSLETVLIIDSYTIPLDDSYCFLNNWKYRVAIHDSYTPPYQVNLVVAPSVELITIENCNVPLLSGPDYIPIRKSIFKIKPDVVTNSEPSLLVVGGGSDPFQFCSSLACELDKLEHHLNVVFVSNQVIKSKNGKTFETYPIGTRLDLLANKANYALCTASTTALEFIAKELPIGIVATTPNQENFYNQLSFAGLATPIGRYSEENGWDFDLKNLNEFLFSVETRIALYHKYKNLIDLRGAWRIINFIEKAQAKYD
jgi:spore coat polysaccharide biosynthesis predicted glycosyltransferase SpsG